MEMKDKTPITAMEMVEAFKRENIITCKCGIRELDVNRLMEQYAKAKVLEALKEEVPKAFSSYIVDKFQLMNGNDYFEREVKPKYEQ